MKATIIFCLLVLLAVFSTADAIRPPAKMAKAWMTKKHPESIKEGCNYEYECEFTFLAGRNIDICKIVEKCQ